MEEVLLLLYANNFFNCANYLALLMPVVLVWKNHGKLIVPKEVSFYLLIFSSLSYMVIYIYNYGILSLSAFFLRGIAPIILYHSGYVVGIDGFSRVGKCVLIMAIGGFLHGFLNVITNLNVNFLLINGRQYNDIYGGYLSGTLQNLYFISICSLALYFIAVEKNKRMKLIGTCCILFGLYGSITNASRTLLFITLIVFMASILIYQCNKTNFLFAITNTGGIILSLSLIALLVIWTDMFHVQEWFASTALGRRESIAFAGSTFLQNDRWVYAREILRRLPANPMGNIDYSHYAHNLWLDIAKESGIIPFILYISYSISAVILAVRAIKNNSYELKDKLLIFSPSLGIFLTFFSEPIMQGHPITFTVFCFIVGGVSSALRGQRRRNGNGTIANDDKFCI